MAYKSLPPGATSGHRPASRRDCSSAMRAMSDGRRRTLISGWRRMTPVPEQGASTSTRSKRWPSQKVLGSAASPVMTRACSPSRSRVLDTFTNRPGSLSTATRRAAGEISRRCAALPPGAAQASRTWVTGPNVEQRCRKLGSRVLDGDRPHSETGQRRGLHRAREHQPLIGMGRRAGGDPGVAQLDQVGIAAGAPRVDPDRHRRGLVVGRRDGLPVAGPGPSKRAQEPFGVRETCAFGGGALDRCLAGGEETPQDRIDDRDRPGFLQAPTGLGGGRHGGMRGHAQAAGPIHPPSKRATTTGPAAPSGA